MEYESDSGKKRKVLSVKEENSNPESESEDNMDPKINSEWSSGQPYVQIKVKKLFQSFNSDFC